MILFLLPFADSKTIRVPVASDALPSTLGVEIAAAFGVLGLLALVFLVAHLWRMLRPVPKAAAETWVLIDGSNVMHWQDNTPRLEPVQKVVDQVRRLGYVPGVVFDANAGWKLFDRYLHDADFARLLGLEQRQVRVVAKGTPADPFLLQTARDFDARIITNDRFRDWSADHPEVTKPGFLIRGELRGANAWLDGLQPVEAPVRRE